MKPLTLIITLAMLSSVAHARSFTDKLEDWAADQVIAAFPNDETGVYDTCIEHSDQVRSTGIVVKETGELWAVDEMQPIGLGAPYSDELKDACAIIMFGAEY